MTESTAWQSVPKFQLRTRSMGVKLILVCVLALFMIIPSFLVESIVSERQSRRADVVREISQYVGGQQTFLGPVLAIPYTVPTDSPNGTDFHGTYLVSPTQASASVKASTEERHRSLFKVPVFHADLKLDSTFDLTGVPLSAPQRAQFDWNRAEIVVGVSDARGAQADATLTASGDTYTLAPATVSTGMQLGSDHGTQLHLILFGAHVPDIAVPGAQFSVSSSLRFSGAQRLAVLSYGKTTRLTVQGDWKNPSFDGGFLPVRHNIDSSGFSADWSVPFIARGIAAEGDFGSISGLENAALGISFVELADPYQSVERALKYIPLFLGLIFLTYFLFEVTTGKRVHPAQYILVGLAQIIFYLLLLSFAERIGFDAGFLIAGVASVALLSANASWVFVSRLQGVRALAIFGLLYALIYLLLRLEDNALLLGAIASFAAISAAMYFTRKIDWYSSPQPPAATTGDADAQ